MQYRISSPIRRLGAFLIESFLNILILIILPLSLSEPLGENLPFAVLGIYISYIVIKMYFWTRSTTLGKALLHMRIVDTITWEKLGFWKVAYRQTIGKFVSFAGLNLGYIWIFIDSNHQAWHDKIARCYIVDEDVLVQGKVKVKDYDPYVKG
ncbi:RDD family protein [Fusibacter sp. JL216-2]|uniref:RDD family protein n=1 Tax=Fusibacter sp. JL216-2 TaxID=3071453 RepID=UPI003D32779E